MQFYIFFVVLCAVNECVKTTTLILYYTSIFLYIQTKPERQGRSDVNDGTLFYAATQNVLKYAQTHREIEVLADTSYCFIVYALAIVNNTLLTSSCTLHSREFLR